MTISKESVSDTIESMLETQDLTDVLDDLEFIEDDDDGPTVIVDDEFIELHSQDDHDVVAKAEDGVRALLESGPSVPIEHRVPIFRDVIVALVILNRTMVAASLIRALRLLQPEMVQSGLSLVPSETMEKIQMYSSIM